ncbi:MFS transporter [Aerobium aerolatum]|uniref:Predicted arabinose efflux permease, MFS family n=1 Tax=Aquamicrobium aerolatum DSM 21857 TaxID=1121003 RepID=A0A1I3NYP0_9HYPH|nr:MFS transporter [Aquamicrobium aerolatum]SFJ14424.1 Predicted arabinose efflux permease, MFS family [Aquamicrobium aerolatum DSM 21857]
MMNATLNSGIDSRYAWIRLVISVLIATIGSVGMWSVVVVLPAVQAEFAVDRSVASLPYTMTMVGFAVGNVWLGRIVDRAGIFLPLAGVAVALLVGYVGAAMAPSIWLFALLQAVIGFGASATFGPLIADLSHWFRKRRGVAVAAAASGNYLAGAIWPLAMQLTLADEGWRFTYAAIGIFCIVTMVPLALLLRRRAPTMIAASDGAQKPAGQRSVDLSPRALQWLLAIAGVGCCVAMAMPQVHIVAYCVDLGFGVARGAEMLSLMLVGGIVSRLASGFLADYIGGVKTLLIGTVLQCLALLAYIPFDGLASLYIVSLVFGLSQGGIVPSYAIIVREYLPAHEAGQRVGIVIMATIVGMALGGWLSGWIYDLTGSYAAAFWNGIAWNVLNIAIMLFILMRGRAPAALRA